MEELIVSQVEGTIDGNFDTLKAQVMEVAERYKGLVVTEDTIAGAKKDRAELNKLKTKIDTVRKEAKNEFMKPYQAFETKVKDLMAIVEEPMNAIDVQLKDFEDKRKADKQIHIQELYDTHIGIYKDYIPLEVVRKPQWDNATYKDADIIYDISEKIQSVKEDFIVIEKMCVSGDDAEELKRYYVQCGYKLAPVYERHEVYAKAIERAMAEVKPEPIQKEYTEDAVTFTVSAADAQEVAEYLDFAEIRYEMHKVMVGTQK